MIERLDLQIHEFAAHVSMFQDQAADAYRQFESSRPRAARIEIENAGARLLLGNVTVARDHRMESRCLWLEIERREIVQHKDGNTIHFEHFSLWQSVSPRRCVDIAAHGGDGGYGGQIVQNLG